MDLDAYQEELGGITRYQVAVILATGLLSFGSAFTSQSSAILSAVPIFRCAVPPIDDSTCFGLNEVEILNLTIPYDSATNKYVKCYRNNYNQSACSCNGTLECLDGSHDMGQTSCDYGYHFDKTFFDETAVTEWNLVCDRQYLDSLSNTIFFLGIFVGSMFTGPICDWFGRKPGMLISCIGLIASGIGSAFTPTYEIYVFTRFLVGMFVLSCFITMFTYANEISNTKWRTEVGMFANAVTGVAHSIYPGIAYAIRDWRPLMIIFSCAPILFLIVFPFIPESPRWLLRVGKYDAARDVVKLYAKSKGQTLSQKIWKEIVEKEELKIKQARGEQHRRIAAWDLFRKPIMRLITINIILSWFFISMIFYGLALNGGNLAGDPYLNLALNGIVEIVAFIFVYFAAPFGRIPVLSSSYILAGLSCIVSMLFNLYADGNQALFTASTAFAIIGKLFASVGFAVVCLVTSELYPTDARVTGISVGSMAARVGTMLTPFILQAQTVLPWFTQTLFGSTAILAGLGGLCFPETGKVNFFNTINEAEQFYRQNTTVLKNLASRCSSQSSLRKNLGEDNNISIVEDEETTNKSTKL